MNIKQIEALDYFSRQIVQKVIIVVVMTFCFLLTNCNRGPLFENHHPLPEQTWLRSGVAGNQPLKFSVHIPDSSRRYTAHILIMHDHKISCEKLMTYLNIIYPDGQEKYIERNIELKSDEGFFIGIPHEQAILLDVSFLERTTFNATGLFVFELGNLMDKFETRGIHSIGLRVEIFH